jgi:hypothetical protein
LRSSSTALVLAVALCAGAPAGSAEDTGEDPYRGLHPYTGDIHVHTGLALYQALQPKDPHSVGTPDQVLDAAEVRGLDFVVITDHSNNLNDPRGIRWREEHGRTFSLPGGGTTASEWEDLQTAVARRNRPGRFLAFLGLEDPRGPTETTTPGHQLGIFPGDSLPRYCSNFPHNTGDCPTAGDFFAFVKEQGGVASMAHPCETVFWGSSDWSEYDPVVNSMELVSGKCEFDRFGYNYALKDLGLRIGIRGSSDSHHFEVGANDKTICFAPELTREAILEAMRENLCYFVDRYPVDLRFSINGVPMGGDLVDEGSGIAVTATAHSDWDTDFDHMELIHDGEVIQRTDCEDYEYDDCALSTFILSETGGYYYVALSSFSDRRIAVSSPIWVRSGP